MRRFFVGSRGSGAATKQVKCRSTFVSAVGAAVCPLDADSACISEKMDVVSRSLERSKGSKSKIVEYK